MKRFFVLSFAVLTLSSIALIGCPSKNSPSSPSGGSTGPNYTPTETAICNPYYTFGKSAVGASSSSFSNGDLFMNEFTLSSSGNVYRLHADIPTAPSAGTSVQMAVYTNNAGAPQSLIVQSSVQAAVQGWNTFDIPATILAAGSYWIGLTSSGSGGVPLAYDTGGPTDTKYPSVSPGSLPASISSTSSSNWDFSFYAEYCVGAGTATPVPTVTLTFTPSLTPTSTFTYTQTPSSCAGIFAFGKNYQSAGAQTFNTGYYFGDSFTLPVGGKVTNLHCYVAQAGGENISMALYDNASPHNLLAQSNSVPSVTGWNNLPVPATGVLAAGTYWILLTTSSSVSLSMDNSLSTVGVSGSGSFTSTLSYSANQTWSFSFYADYCVPIGSPTPPPSPTLTFTTTATPTNTPTLTQTPVPACLGSYSAGSNWPRSAHGVFNNYTYMFCSAITMTASGNVTMLHYLSGAAGGNLQMGLYTNSGGAPHSLLTYSTSAQAAVSGVNNVTVPATVVGPGVYWVVTMPTYNTGVDFYDDAIGPPSNGGYWMYSPGATTVFPSTSTGGTDQGYIYSMWADFCVISGTATPADTITWTPTPSFTFTYTPTITQTPVCASPSHLGATAVLTPTTFGGGNMLATGFVLSSSATITGLNVYLSAVYPPTSMIMALYGTTGSAPGALIVQSNEQTPSTGWNYFQVPQVGVAGPTTVWIAVAQSNTGSGIGICYMSPGTNMGYHASYSPYPFSATVPGTFPAGGAAWDEYLDVYLDKCP